MSYCGRVVLDGLNLRLRQGTGIANYGVNLARLLGQLNFGVDVLYDRPTSGKADPLKRELSFHAALSQGRSGRFGRLLGRMPEAASWTIALARGAGTSEVNQDIVLADDALPNHPNGAGILTSSGLFRKASASAKLLHRPLRVHLPAGSALHLTYAIPMVAVNAPTIMTLHDVIPLRLPHTVHDRKLRFLKHLRVIAESADHITAVSESAKKDLLQAIPLPPEKITVTYQPVRPAEELDPRLAADIVEKIHGLTPGEYFLFTGAIEPKKNLPRLIEAYLLSGAKRPLVIVGPDGWAVEEQLAPLARYRARSQRPTEQILRLGYVPRLHLAALLSQAHALLFPSLYEGFGLPMVEAMQLGVPVLAGSLGALPEIAGGAAVLTDPFDVTAIARGIRELDSDTDLHAELQVAGPRNAARFSDAACRERLVSAYRAAGIDVPGQLQGEAWVPVRSLEHA